jgi:hypothetical protein
MGVSVAVAATVAATVGTASGVGVLANSARAAGSAAAPGCSTSAATSNPAKPTRNLRIIIYKSLSHSAFQCGSPGQLKSAAHQKYMKLPLV